VYASDAEAAYTIPCDGTVALGIDNWTYILYYLILLNLRAVQ